MRKKWMIYLTSTLKLLIIIFYYKQIPPMLFVLFLITLAFDLYDLLKDKF